MKKKLFCIFGLILIVSAIAYFCHDHSVLPLDAKTQTISVLKFTLKMSRIIW